MKENNNSFAFEIIIDFNFNIYFSLSQPTHAWADLQGFEGC